LTRIDLNDKKIASFLSGNKPKLLRLAVVSRENPFAPHVSSIWYLWGEGYFWLTTSEDRLKVRAIRKNPRVALIVDTDVAPYKGVIVEGDAELTKERVEEITLAIVKRYVPARRVKKEYDHLMKYPRILIKIKPTKAIDIMSYKTR
jgi:nitroimidazol reductase NimA-like FMN-containing flavoprotein (pyridoxamine 5'-phosphate oxidase superfamily)